VTLRGSLWLVLATLACLLPFVDKAFHIDDVSFLWTARQIGVDAADFYGFRVNCSGRETAMTTCMAAPPLAGYYLAGGAALAGWSERALHLVYLLPALAAVLGSYALAASLCRHPGLAAWLTLLCPVFVVSSTSVMSDTLLLACFVWALALWHSGLARGSAARLAGAAVCVALAALIKYFGASLLPLLFAQGLAQRRRVGAWALWLLLPVAALAAYQAITSALYGQALLSEAGSFSGGFRAERGLPLWAWGVTTLSFGGGCLATVAFCGPWCWSRRWLGLGLAAVAAGLLGLAHAGQLGSFPLVDAGAPRWTLLAQLGVWLLAGLSILGLVVADLRQRRDAGSLLLGLWLLGTLAFAGLFNWSVTARAILPAAPAAAILAVRRLEARGVLAPGRKRRALAAPLALGAALSLAVAHADYAWAGSARQAARRVAQLYGQGSGTLWFEGHWGFQYYLEALGGRAVDWLAARPRPGERLVIPGNNTNTFLMPQVLSLQAGLAMRSPRWLASMHRAVGAGFYSDVWGPLPFAVGRVPAERYLVFEVGSHVELGRALEARGRIAHATDEYRAALDRDPDDARAHYALGAIDQRQGRLDPAIEHFRQAAFHAAPGDRRALRALADASRQRDGHHGAVIAFLEEAVRRAPGSAETHLLLGHFLRASGQLDRAIDAYRRAQALEPGNPTLRRNLDEALAERARP
jgi:tetratricopeptide (TPR) repeat protein